MDEQANLDLDFFRKNSKQDYLKCFDLIRSIIEDPRNGIGKPERLKGYGDREVYSRRINDKDRVSYIIFEDKKEILITDCRGHYGDK
jgi:toxin YoeB